MFEDQKELQQNNVSSAGRTMVLMSSPGVLITCIRAGLVGFCGLVFYMRRESWEGDGGRQIWEDLRMVWWISMIEIYLCI